MLSIQVLVVDAFCAVFHAPARQTAQAGTENVDTKFELYEEIEGQMYPFCISGYVISLLLAPICTLPDDCLRTS